jgi:glycosyltransferase domain-containing protein
MKLIIPTYNRSAKLHRTLKYYMSLRDSINCEIVVLDGSTDDHAEWNKKHTEQSDRISYIKFDSNISFLGRVLNFLESCPADELITFGNDEDVFLPSYIADSEEFLMQNPSYSSYIGRFITLARPIFGLNRLSHFRDFVSVNDIYLEDPCRRISTLMSMLLVGCSPVYFSTRRNSQLLGSIRLQLKLGLESTQELLDQTYLALSGKIKFVNDVMMLRDETNLGYKFYDTRHSQDLYITDDELSLFKRVLLEDQSVSGLCNTLDVLTDCWRSIEIDSSKTASIALTRHKNTYSSFKSLNSNNAASEAFVRNISRAGTIVAQLVSWFFIKRELLTNLERKSLSIFLRRVKTHGLYTK